MSPSTTLERSDAHAVGEHGEYLPSIEEIRRHCAEIRKSWSERERQSRANEHSTRWVVPVYRIGRPF